MTRSSRGARALTSRLFALVAVVPLVALAAPQAPAAASSLGGLDVVPAKGTAQTPMSVITERGCAEPAERVSAVLTGDGLPERGQVVLSPTEVLFSTTRPMELPLSNAFVVYAERNATALTGTYTITVRCTDRIGVNVLDTFTTTMTWKTPANARANVAEATYVAKSTAGVVDKAPASVPSDGGEAKDAPDDANDSDASTGDDAETPAAGPGQQPLANDELPDGSNADARAATDDVAAPTERAGGNAFGPVVWVGLAVSALLFVIAAAFFRGSRSHTS